MAACSEVIVFGSLNLDIAVNCDRHPELGETVFGTSVTYLPGGKGLNQAVAAARWGAWTRLIGAIGQDEAGDTLIGFLHSESVQITHVERLADTASGTALITVSRAGGNTIVVVPGANAKAAAPLYLNHHGRPIGLSQFEVPLPQIETFFRSIHAAGGRTILNPSPFRPVPEALLEQTDILIVNEAELAQLTGAAENSDPDSVKAALSILNRPGQVVIVTLGAKGCLYYCDGDAAYRAAEDVPVLDTTGAGDCFAGVFAACLAKGQDYASALSKANTAAALSTTRHGAAVSMPTKQDVDAFIDHPLPAGEGRVRG